MLKQVEWMNNGGGLDFAAGRSDQSAEILYGWAEASEYASPFVENSAERSPVVGTIDIDEFIGEQRPRLRSAQRPLTPPVRAGFLTDIAERVKEEELQRSRKKPTTTNRKAAVIEEIMTSVKVSRQIFEPVLINLRRQFRRPDVRDDA